MATRIETPRPHEIDYPEYDGQPMADNTRQFEWIVTIKGGLDALFRDDPNVFVAGDLLWYPIEGDNKTRTAPDAMVVFGRPKGHRGSYKQWVEDGVGPQVVFEVLSPGNRAGKDAAKFRFYERFGVEEFYVYDPDRGELAGWLRSDDVLTQIPQMNGWTSPRLGMRFSIADGELVLTGPDGKRFATYVELAVQRDNLAQQRDRERDRAERLEAQLRQLGIEPDA